jgi:decaprenylphospho-beta-D-erythro-pentofuranosid-2-ulose 2-reductase
MHVLLLGANSDTGIALAHQFAGKDGADLYLASRDMQELEKHVSDIQLRYQVKARACYFDVTDTAAHGQFYQSFAPKPDIAVLSLGYLGNQLLGQKDFNEAEKIIDTNFTGAVSVLEIIAADFEMRKHGTIIIFCSVAGERGRKSNYLYGSAKAGLIAYASGLRNRLFSSGVHVVTVMPGFVDTKMTSGMELPAPLLAEPGQVAADIHRMYKRKNVIYSKRIWQVIMLAVRNIPEPLFKRLNL